MKAFKFTYNELENFLIYAKKIAPFISFGETNHKNGIILRHDVDWDIYPAYTLSKIEKRLGVTSTFFIMVTAHTYNPLSLQNRRLLSEMSRDGFEIGLHFDPVIYGDMNFKDLRKKVDLECQILGSVINGPVTSISLHNPPSISGGYLIFEGYNNAYSEDIFSNEIYMSDSCMDFRSKNPYEFVNKARDTSVQILLHPEHWSKKGGDYIDVCLRYTHNLMNQIDENFKLNFTYKKDIKNNKLWDILIDRGKQ